MSIAARIAFRELRGGLAGFRIFLLCLALGVAGIAAIGSVRSAIEQGLIAQSTALLGGDADMEFSYRSATPGELEWMDANAAQKSEIIDMRSMALHAEQRMLVQLKGVDNAYPLYGDVTLSPAQPLDAALAVKNGVSGAVAARTLVDRMGLEIGDMLQVGRGSYQLRAVLAGEPDSAGTGFAYGPRVIVSLASLRTSGVLSTGTLFKAHYRLKFPPATDLAKMQSAAESALGGKGMRWTDSRDGTPSLSKFVDRMGAFLVIVGLAGLAVGGVGVSAAVHSYLDGKKQAIATLKTLGASSATIFWIYLIQIGVLAIVGIAIGLVAGVGAPLVFGPLFADSLPIPAAFAVYGEPVLEAGTYGFLTAMIFTIWPLGRALKIRAAALYRDETLGARHTPNRYFVLLVGFFAVLLISLAAWFSGVPKLALWSAFSITFALFILFMTAIIVKKLARALGRSRLMRGHPVLRLSLAAIGGPGGEAGAVIVSLGLGLSVLAAVGQIDTNMRNAITADIPAEAPAYLFIDIQKDQYQGFLKITQGIKGVTRTSAAPMLRAVITSVNGIPAKTAFANHWVANGDHAVTFSDVIPEATTVTEGAWWPEGYAGTPQISFISREAGELGLKLGDRITVNVLGRDMTATLTSLRDVHFPDMQANFLMVMNPSALQAAPHTYIATVYGPPTVEPPLLNAVATTYPNITAIRVRNMIDKIVESLDAIASATRWGAAATLLTGFVVLIGAAAAGERSRVYEAALLKTLGASRARILASFALRSALLGGAAGLVAISAGGMAGWAVMTFVMSIPFHFALQSAVLIVGGGAFASLLTGLAFAWRPLAARPAQVLRAQE